MTELTEGERMVWAAAYAADYVAQSRDRSVRDGPNSSNSILIAWEAVTEMRRARTEMLDRFGGGDDATKMHQEMMK